MATARHADPDFVPSLRLLIECERYSLTDVALMFSVSPERVRQWCKKYGIHHPDSWRARGLNMYRRWNDEMHRFEPMPRGQWTAQRRRGRAAARRTALRERTAERRRQIVLAIRELARRNGQPPTACAVYTAITGNPTRQGMPLLVSMWVGNRREGPSYAAIMDEMFAMAGVPRRRRNGVRPR